MRKNGFPPIGSTKPEILILGSMPGEASLAGQEYYAHPRNSFWPIMGAIYGAGPEMAYPERIKILARAKIAVWDTLASCIRAGSLDSAILEEKPNDFSIFLGRESALKTVIFNGAKAENCFRKLILPHISFEGRMQRVPSTSPAHAGMKLQTKIEIWRNALNGAAGED